MIKRFFSIQGVLVVLVSLLLMGCMSQTIETKTYPVDPLAQSLENKNYPEAKRIIAEAEDQERWGALVFQHLQEVLETEHQDRASLVLEQLGFSLELGDKILYDLSVSIQYDRLFYGNSPCEDGRLVERIAKMRGLELGSIRAKAYDMFKESYPDEAAALEMDYSCGDESLSRTDLPPEEMAASGIVLTKEEARLQALDFSIKGWVTGENYWFSLAHGVVRMYKLDKKVVTDAYRMISEDEPEAIHHSFRGTNF